MEISKEIRDAVKSRAKVLQSKFPELQEDDLIQSGYELVLTLYEKEPDKSKVESYIFKAINNHYSNLMDEAILDRKKTVSLDDLVDKGYEPVVGIDGQPGIDISNCSFGTSLPEDLSIEEREFAELILSGCKPYEVQEELGLSSYQFAILRKNILLKMRRSNA